MSDRLLLAVRYLVGLWARLYSLGLPAMHRSARRELLLADVHEQVAEALNEGAKPASIAWALLSRCLRGVPDDLTWRLFEARRLPAAMPVFVIDRRPVMTHRGPGIVFFAAAAGLAWLATLVMALEPMAHSLAYGGALLTAISLAGWALEARATVEEEAGPSTWPLLLAVGIVAIAGGLVFEGGRTGLLLVVPLSLGLSAAFARVVAARLGVRDKGGIEPLAASDLARHAAAGEAIAIETVPPRGVTRRAVLRGGFSLGLASVLATMGGVMVDFLWQRNVSGFGGVVTAGKMGDFAPGTKTRVQAGKFWLVNLTEAQGGPGFLALWQKCPHLGCVVPWLDIFSHVDPDTGRDKEGWFRCPCHQSTYNDAGVRVFGPAPRSMDRMAVRVTEAGYIEVDTGDISKGSDENATFAVPLSEG